MEESDQNRRKGLARSERLVSPARFETVPSDELDQNASNRELADAKIANAIKLEISRREERKQSFPAEIFGEPAWNILLDLYKSSMARRPVTISDACIASGAPKATALRWIDILVELDLTERKHSDADGRVVYLHLTPLGEARLRDYFSGF